LLDRIWADDRVAFLPEPEDIEKGVSLAFTAIQCIAQSSADAYLLAFAYVAGVKLVTFDQALQSRGVHVLLL
jgi:predicted nucleic acid-binding protein